MQAATSLLFWNRAPKRNGVRFVDPLGIDALREAMADALVPLLTGATRRADEYVWTILGLKWAKKTTASSIDETIFNRGFSPFERALKQYWYRPPRRRKGAGNIVVRRLCEGLKPDVSRPILVNQRATGLLGAYIVSLRGMGLVERDSLLLIENSTDSLLGGLDFAPQRNWLSSWDALASARSGCRYKE